MHVAEALVDQTHGLVGVVWVSRHGDILTALVHVLDHQINLVVACHIGKPAILLPQLLPHGKVPVEFVEVLMDDNEPDLTLG